MEKVLVTGATGFIGGHLRVALERIGSRVVAVTRARRPQQSRDGIDWVEADISKEPISPALLKEVHTVFHLAGHAHALDEFAWRDDIHRQLNELGTRRLVETAGQSGVRRFVFFSSIKAMGEDGNRRLDEFCDLAPTTAYGKAKLAAETAVLQAGERYGMHVCNLRLSLVYGAGVKGNLARMIQEVDRGRFPPLPALENKRSMVDVRDVVRAALLVAECPQANGKTYILTDDHPYSTYDLYLSIRRALGKGDPRWSVPLPMLHWIARFGDIIGKVRKRRFMFDSDTLKKLTGSAWYSSTRITRELNFVPSYTFEDALPDMIDAYRGSNAGR